MEFNPDLPSCLKNLITSEDEIYSDFTVEVEDKIFPCHRFILSACSAFFRALFQSDMKETIRNSFHLRDVSSETFKLIYGFIYLHHNGLSEVNFLDAWKAAHFLEIDFIVSICQQVAMETISEANCHRYLWHAKFLDSRLMAKIVELITSNFDLFKDSECIMELDGKVLLGIVRDPNLKTSQEENVVDAILKWVSHSTDGDCLSSDDSDNLRADYLIPLLSASRLTSLNEKYLVSLCHHKQIVDNASSRDLISKASTYMTCSMPNYLPTFASHRKCSQWEDVVLVPSFHEFILKPNVTFIKVFNLKDKKITEIRHCSELKHEGVLHTHQGGIYACGYTSNKEASLSMFFLEHGHWKKVSNVKYANDDIPPRRLKSQVSFNNFEWSFQARLQTLISFSVGDHIFVVNANNRRIYKWDPLKRADLKQVTSVPAGMPVIHANAFKSLILAICGTHNNSALLNVYDTARGEWNPAVPLDGIYNQTIASFNKEDVLYFLTSDAKVYAFKTEGGGGVTLKHVTTYPNFSHDLIGATVYGEELFVFVKEFRQHEVKRSLRMTVEFPGLFSHVTVIGIKGPCPTLVSTSMLRDDIKPFHKFG